MTLYTWFQVQLATSRGRLYGALAVLMLVLPALFSPLVADDLLHEMRFTPETAIGGFDDPDMPFFVFATGDPAQRHAAMEEGVYTWWTAEDLHFAFWRPVSGLTHRLDHVLWPGQSVLIHAHSLLWFFLLLAALSRLYDRTLGPQIAIMALLLYAVDDARGMVLSFAANRNALIAAVLGVLVLIAHDRWRREGSNSHAVLAPLLLGVALLAGESAIATTGYLFGYALFIDRGKLATRAMTLAPYTAVVLVWQAVYSGLGYGASSSGVYVHPLHDPVTFVARLVERAPVLLQGQLAAPTSDIWFVLSGTQQAILYGLIVLTIGALAWVFWRRIGARPEARFYATGMLLSLVPVSATFTNDRLLVFAGIGAFGLVALLLEDVRQSPPEDRLTRWIAVALVVVHLVIAPLTLPARAWTMGALNTLVTRIDRTIPDTPDIEGRSLVIVQSLTEGAVGYPLIRRAYEGTDRPRALRLLSTGSALAEVERLDAYTLRISPGEGYYSSEVEQLLRDPRIPFEVGDTVVLSDMTVTIVEVDDAGRAWVADFTFVAPLEDPQFLWTLWRRGELEPWTPPAVGERVVLPRVM